MKMVVIGYKNHEDLGSCSYDREYKLCLLSELEGKESISEEEYNMLGDWIKITGTKFPDIKRVEGVAPFEIKPTTVYKVRQKQAKTVTVYE